ncbi:11070_t:CDS:1, partial [Funneliformis geosporum]
DEQHIASFINQRVNNVTENPSAMIDSCLERRKTSIILDRDLVKGNKNQPYLELDPSNVLSHASDHFQKIANSKNSNKVSHPSWKLW